METSGINKKLLIILSLAVVVIIIVIATIVVLAGQNSSETPKKTKVTPGQTITQQQISRGNIGDQTTNGTVTPSASPTAQPTAVAKAPTATDLYNLIAESHYVPGSFGVVKTENPQKGWYVVTIKSGNLEPAKVIVRQTNDPNNPLTIVAGPGTNFPPDTISLPDAVRKVVDS